MPRANGQVVYDWGLNSLGQLGTGDTIERPSPTQPFGLAVGATSVSAGVSYSLAAVNGAAMGWGYNADGQLGNNSTTNSLVPVNVFGLTSGVTEVRGTGDVSLAIQNGAVKSWGANEDGQWVNGDPNGNSSLVPVNVVGLQNGVTSISLRIQQCAAIQDGAVKAWGVNGRGQSWATATPGPMRPCPFR